MMRPLRLNMKSSRAFGSAMKHKLASNINDDED